MGSIYFISPVAYGMNPVFTVVDTFIFPIQLLGLGRNVALMAAFLLPDRNPISRGNIRMAPERIRAARASRVHTV